MALEVPKHVGVKLMKKGVARQCKSFNWFT
jgi:hypothetical protein